MNNENGVKAIPDGVYPTMITPFTVDNKIDYFAVEKMIKWYFERGCSGIFSVCQSSEMFFLSDEEKIQLVEFVAECSAAEANNRGIIEFPILASGHVYANNKQQAELSQKMYEAGANAIVLITNRFEGRKEGDEIWIDNAENLLELLPDIPLGLYECPYPHKRYATQRILEWCLSKECFIFFKDTCCDINRIIDRLPLLNGSNMKLFNANSQTLLPSLIAGASGYSGIMANFHPELYKRLIEAYAVDSEAELLQSFLSLASLIGHKDYPVCAKFHMNLLGVQMSLHTRGRKEDGLHLVLREEIRNLFQIEEALGEKCDETEF